MSGVFPDKVNVQNKFRQENFQKKADNGSKIKYYNNNLQQALFTL